MTDAIAVLGAGAWGTALAVHLARAAPHLPVVLWARDAAQARAISAARENVRYLAGVALPDSISITAELSGALAGSPALIVATPMSGLLPLVDVLRESLPAPLPLAWLCKGLVADSRAPSGVSLAHQTVISRWSAPVAVISGPSFAEEVAAGLPTAVCVAASAPNFAERLAQRLRGGGALRVYVSDDIAGVEVGGAVKNVLAIAAGASDGLGFGDNARAALITHGLAETGRLSEALGGRRETLMGLSGLGDLVLTCTGDRSRNRRVGLGLARGDALPDVLARLGHVAEGVPAARSIHAVATSLAIDMPICDAVYRVLYESLEPRRAVAALLAREPARE